MNTQLKTPARSQSQSQPSHTVSKPKHQSTKQFHSSTSTSLSLVSDFLQQKAALEKERFKMPCKHEARQEEEKDHKQEKGEKIRKADMVKLVLSMDWATDVVKAVANNYLLSLFKA